ncbi:Aste57867_14094 [Aphanomyces stellatus]|uniref:Aste57867_14094 protein n=1 Tax=Aphanomyces stellatus TaxID=120398 RepID=A0A485KZW5_9STRA|nr:hypothetical protein As57867_014043 [Aphanomyces stellatus]VFT90922.1 Aste57867_14094 [Aphanomyces stellatus]
MSGIEVTRQSSSGTTDAHGSERSGSLTARRNSASSRASLFGRKEDILTNEEHIKAFDMSEVAGTAKIQSLSGILFDGFSLRFTWPGFWLWFVGTGVTIATLVAAYMVTKIDGHEINPGLVMGAAQTFFTSCFVIVTFHGVHAYQRHPNPLLYYRAIMDLLLSVRFLFDPLWIHFGFYTPNDPSTCRYLSAATEFLFISADAWFFVLTLDLLISLNNPFTSVKRNQKLYYRGVYFFAVVLSIVVASRDRFFGLAEGKFCWTYAKRYDLDPAINSTPNPFMSFNPSTWVAFFSWMVLFYAFAFYVLGTSLKRLRTGLSKTMETRKGMLRDGALSIISYTLYWTVTFSLYAASYTPGNADALRENPVFKLYCYVLAGRGVVTFFLWFVINSPVLVLTKWLHFSQEGIDTNISAQLNTSLQNDLLEYTVKGMLRAIRESDEGFNDPTASHRLSVQSSTESMSNIRLTVLDSAPRPPTSSAAALKAAHAKDTKKAMQRSVHFVNYRPGTFAQLRAHFHLRPDDFEASFEEATKPSISEGASGAFMFFSKDMRFIVKSMVESEARFLAKIAPDYRDHMVGHADTKLTRFFGCFMITLHGNKFYFVVMENLFANAPEIHHRFDIKGSWVNRSYKNPREGAKVKCRYCSMQFIYHSNPSKQQTCPNLAGPHEPNVVLKDDDLHHRLRIGVKEGRDLFDQLRKDSVFLRDQGIMDYSLLIGVVDVQYKVDKSASGGENPHYCDSISGPGLYYIGVIDILQTWNWNKRLERWLKVWLRQKDPHGLSAIEPYPYQVRFETKLRDIIATEEPEAHDPSAAQHLMPLFAQNSALEMVSFSSRALPQMVKTRSAAIPAAPAHSQSRDDEEPVVWL